MASCLGLDAGDKHIAGKPRLALQQFRQHVVSGLDFAHEEPCLLDNGELQISSSSHSTIAAQNTGVGPERAGRPCALQATSGLAWAGEEGEHGMDAIMGRHFGWLTGEQPDEALVHLQSGGGSAGCDKDASLIMQVHFGWAAQSLMEVNGALEQDGEAEKFACIL